MPLGTKTTQTDSDAKLRWFLDKIDWWFMQTNRKDSETNCKD